MRKIIIPLFLVLIAGILVTDTTVSATQPTKLEKFNEGKKVYSVTYSPYTDDVKLKKDGDIKVKEANNKPKIEHLKNDSVRIEWDTDNVMVNTEFIMMPGDIWMKDLILELEDGTIQLYSFYFDSTILPALSKDELVEYWNEMQSEAIKQFDDYAAAYFGDDWDKGNYSITGRYNSNPFIDKK